MSDTRWVKLGVDEIRELMTPGVAGFALPKHRVRRGAHDKLQAALEGHPHRLLGGGHTDSRGEIRDLIDGPIDSVTWIRTLEGAVRGNHVHNHTTQWTYVLDGRMLISQDGVQQVLEAGMVSVDRPGVAHAWKALTDVDVVVFTLGPRSANGYESDTVRLDTPLLS